MVPLQLDSTGKVKYDVIARMGQRKDKVVHTSLQAMVGQDRPIAPELMKPDEEEIEKVWSFEGRAVYHSIISLLMSLVTYLCVCTDY